jgi:MFS family permease
MKVWQADRDRSEPRRFSVMAGGGRKIPGNVAASSSVRRSKPFLHFMWGCLIFRVGDWMDFKAMNWVIFQWSHSPIALGAVNACRLLPALLCGLPAGMLADRMDRRKLLILLQAGIMLLSIILAFMLLRQFHLGAVLIVIVL